MNKNLVIWTTDWHLVSSDGEPAGTGQPTTPTKAQTLVSYINGLDPAGCIDTGDAKDHYGAVGTADEHDNYITYVGNVLRWLPVNSGFNAEYPVLPGNHDELNDYNVDGSPNNDFSTTWDVKFWGSPYRWTADWATPKIRFIGFHSYIHHQNSVVAPETIDAEGLAHVKTAEVTWLGNELAALPSGWMAFVCSHFPIAIEIGNNIGYVQDTYTYGYTNNALVSMLAGHSSRIVACLSGHRHANWNTATRDGIPHYTSGGVSYGLGNGRGTFTKLTYDRTLRTVTMDLRYATSPYERFAAFTPVVLNLPALPAPSTSYGPFSTIGLRKKKSA